MLVGESGTGKSASAKALVARFGLKHKSAGDFVREVAQSKGITLLQIEALAANDPQYDFEVDWRTTNYGREEDDFVFDGRLAAECIRDAVKVLLVCEDEVRYQRIAASRNMTYEQAKHETDTREASYRERFKRYYGIEDFQDRRKYCFDLVVDTASNPVERVVELVSECLKKKGLCPAAV